MSVFIYGEPWRLHPCWQTCFNTCSPTHSHALTRRHTHAYTQVHSHTNTHCSAQLCKLSHHLNSVPTGNVKVGKYTLDSHTQTDTQHTHTCLTSCINSARVTGVQRDLSCSHVFKMRWWPHLDLPNFVFYFLHRCDSGVSLEWLWRIMETILIYRLSCEYNTQLPPSHLITVICTLAPDFYRQFVIRELTTKGLVKDSQITPPPSTGASRNATIHLEDVRSPHVWRVTQACNITDIRKLEKKKCRRV